MSVDESEDEDSRYSQTWIIIYCFTGSLIINDIFLLYDTIHGFTFACQYFGGGKKYRITNLRKFRG